MRDYSKTGGKSGRPGYRTPSSFRNRKLDKGIKKTKAKKSLSHKFAKTGRQEFEK